MDLLNEVLLTIELLLHEEQVDSDAETIVYDEGYKDALAAIESYIINMREKEV